MVATLAVSLGQPVGDLLDLLGVERCWPDVFNALASIHRERVAEMEKRAARERQEKAVAQARARYG